MRSQFFLTVAALLAVLTLAERGIADDAYDRAVANPSDPSAIDKYLLTLPQIPPGSGKYFVEGDLSLDRDSIVDYLKTKASPSQALPEGELIVNVVGGSLDYLKSPARRKLTYAVVATSFPSMEKANTTNRQLKAAARSWIDACPSCGVSLTEIPIDQAGKFYEKVTFVLTYSEAQVGPIARSFFPSSPADDRQIVIFRDFFADDVAFDRVGILRHEFGHVLGYRHEQLDTKSGCVVSEGGKWTPITAYNPKSVMHYMCGRGGTFELKLSQSDIAGHKCVYLTGKRCS